MTFTSPDPGGSSSLRYRLTGCQRQTDGRGIDTAVTTVKGRPGSNLRRNGALWNGFVRFWTNTCLYCEATAPALRQIHKEFGKLGVIVLGIYHPKPPGTHRSKEEIEPVENQWGWRLPIGVDMEWRALKALWLNGKDPPATSAMLILDQQGTIRFIHPGPEYHSDGPPDHQSCRDDYRDIHRAIKAFLVEKPVMG